MADGARLLLTQGIAAAKAGNKDEARFYLEWALTTDASYEQQIEAWRWLCEISDEPREQRDYLERILSFNPADPLARRKLAVVEGRLNPADIVAPDRLPAPVPAEPQRPQARRFACKQCAGRMVYTPDGQALVCESCGQRVTLADARSGAGVLAEQDFVVALATVKGHARPVATRVLECQGCGAGFVMAPEQLSTTCPYCDSAYVVQLPASRELVEPVGLIPFATSQDQAYRSILAWLDSQKIRAGVQLGRPAGLYAPFWTFDVSGEVRERPRQVDDERDQALIRFGSQAVHLDDLVVPASRKLPRHAESLEFDPGGLVAYDPAYLAAWPAAVYDVSVADASLVARQRALEEARSRGGGEERIEDSALDSTGLVVESYKLILAPLWIGHYRDGERDYGVVANGQSGAVCGERPRQGLSKWLGWLLEDDGN